MTYKAAAAGLDLGGGKAVIFGDPVVDKTEALLRAYGRHVDALGGRYITAEDVGTTQADMDLILRETKFVTGVSQELGGSGDPSAATAYGVLWAMKAVTRRLWDQTVLEGRHVVVAGVGKVGTNLVRHLVEERARVTVADVNPAAVERVVGEYGVEAVPVESVHAVAVRHLLALRPGRRPQRLHHPRAGVPRRSSARPTTSSPIRAAPSCWTRRACSTPPTTW